MKKPKVSIRKPPVAAAEAFVAAGQKPQVGGPGDIPTPFKAKRPAVQTAKLLDVQPSRAIVQRKNGAALRRMTIYLPPDLARRLRIQAAEADRDMSELVADALRKHLGGS